MAMTTTAEFALFETALGPCGIAWGSQGVLGVQLPEASERQLRVRLHRRFPSATETPPPLPLAVQSAIDGIVGLLDGKSSDLSSVELDMEGVPEFHRRVYAVARTIPAGSTLSYGEIAACLGEPAWPAARDVGQALAQNPFPILVPCHRVLAANRKLGGFSARGGRTTKLRLLSIEAGRATDAPHSDFEKAKARAGSASALDTPLFADLR
jgi:methylated-DNA-[protein]-cysteine S-methyltransferase